MSVFLLERSSASQARAVSRGMYQQLAPAVGQRIGDSEPFTLERLDLGDYAWVMSSPDGATMVQVTHGRFLLVVGIEVKDAGHPKLREFVRQYKAQSVDLMKRIYPRLCRAIGERPKGVGATSGGSSGPTAGPALPADLLPRDVKEKVDRLVRRLTSDPRRMDPTSRAVAETSAGSAGVLLLANLLRGLGIALGRAASGGPGLAAAGAASAMGPAMSPGVAIPPAAPGGLTTSPPPSPPPGTRIIDGREAVEYMQKHGLLKDGRLTDKFQRWYDQPHSAPDAAPPGLRGFAGDIAEDGVTPEGNVALIVEGSSPPASPTDTPPPSPPQDNAPPQPAQDSPPTQPAQQDGEQTQPPPPDQGTQPPDAPQETPPPPERTTQPPEAQAEPTPASSQPGSDLPGIPPADPAVVQDLQNRFAEKVREVVDKGYWVKNDGAIKAFFTGLLDLPMNTMSSLRNVPARIADWRGGRCGDFAHIGRKWAEDIVDQLNVDGAVVDTIIVEEASTANPSGVYDWIDSWYESNHIANRVILPSGERYVLDFWESASTGKPAMVPEDQWIARWKDRVTTVAPEDFTVSRTFEEADITEYIRKAHGRGGDIDAGLQDYLDYHRKIADKMTARGDDIGAQMYMEKKQTMVNSWRRHPW